MLVQSAFIDQIGVPYCSVLCTATLLQVDWEAKVKLVQPQQRTIYSPEAGTVFRDSPETVLEVEARHLGLKGGTQLLRCSDPMRPSARASDDTWTAAVISYRR